MQQKKIYGKELESNSNKNISNLFLKKKTSHSNNEINNEIKINDNNVNNRGKWTEDEQNKFIEGIALHGTNWKKVQNLIKTRSEVQIRSYSKNFFRKLKSIKDELLGLDFSLNSICDINDIILQIKNTNKNYNISNVLKYLYNKYIISKKNKKNSLNKHPSETCQINETNICDNRPNNNNNSNNNKLIIFNNFNIINNNIRVNPSNEFIILQYWLILLNINQQINNFLISLIINNLLLNNSTFLNNCNKDEHNYNISHLLLFLLLLIYICQISNDKIQYDIKAKK